MSGNLPPWIGEGVESLVDLFLQDLELNGYDSGNEDVVEGFGLNADIKLLDAVGHPPDNFFDAADEAAETGRGEAFEFSELFDYSHFCRGDCEWNLCRVSGWIGLGWIG